MTTLYVLQLQYGKWYVGKTSKMEKRFEQHKSGKGCAWTSMYKPISIAESRPLKDEFDEDNTTRQYMKKYGIANVRGGSHTRIELSDGEEEVLLRQIRSAEDKCFQCGQKGHFCRNCPNKQEEYTTQKLYCSRCGRCGHFINMCSAFTNVNGQYIGHPPYDPRYDYDSSDSE